MKDRPLSHRGGFSLIETMIAVFILSIILMAGLQAYTNLGRGLIKARRQTIASYIAQERMESLKSLAYSRLLATPTAALQNPDDPTNPYPPEYNIIVGDMNFDRFTTIKKVRDNAGVIQNLAPDAPDEGLKKITIEIRWIEDEGVERKARVVSLYDDPNRKASGEVSGKVYGLYPQVLANARVRVEGNPIWEVVTDASGNYSLSIPTGSYTLRASRKGYESRTISLTITEGGVATANFYLPKIPTGKITGYVLNTALDPIAGALVYCNDPISSPVQANTSGQFNLPEVASGTWTISASHGTSYGETQNVVVHKNITTHADIILSIPSTQGYISGRILGDGSDVTNILVEAGFSTDTTDSNGRYKMALDPGTYTVVANPDQENHNYTSQSRTEVVVTLGQETVDIDFDLHSAGGIKGKVTSNGVDPLANIVISARDKNGFERGYAFSDKSGNYKIPGLVVGASPYTLTPILDIGDMSNPASYSLSLSKGTTITSKDFIVTSAWGKISGRVSTVDGQDIKTGVLIMASTSTIPSSLPPIDQTLREGGITYYGTISTSQGKYCLRVRRGNTYNLAGWYTTLTPDGITTTRRDRNNITLNAQGEAVVNLVY